MVVTVIHGDLLVRACVAVLRLLSQQEFIGVSRSGSGSAVGGLPEGTLDIGAGRGGWCPIAG